MIYSITYLIALIIKMVCVAATVLSKNKNATDIGNIVYLLIQSLELLIGFIYTILAIVTFWQCATISPTKIGVFFAMVIIFNIVKMYYEFTNSKKNTRTVAATIA